MSEHQDESGGEVVAFPGQPSDDPERDLPGNGRDVEDFEDFLTGASMLDDFTSDDYLSATTEEYRDLAEAIAKASQEDVEMQAVAASMPGLEPGLVGFDDVTGEQPAADAGAGPGPSDTLVRAATGVVLLAVILALLALGGGWFALLVAVLALVALGEFYSTLRGAGHVPLALFGFLGAIAVLSASWFSDRPLAAMATALGGTIVVILFWYALVPRRNPLENASFTIFGVIWVAGLLSFAMPIIRSPQSRQLIIAIVVLTALFDAGSYFVGRSFGRILLAPNLSPSKTLEGLVGGVIVAFVAAFGLSLISWFGFGLGGALWTAAIISLFAPLGDLAESLVKRALGVKDMGALLPGHGGIIDRLDSYLFTIPVGYVLFLWLGYLS
ncbi:MAG: phosphatidate cytidylyltransferase [Actinobacteria bacterium]|nr:phosphatidate cytidylyltransferase [Actinomycetota bacterium]